MPPPLRPHPAAIAGLAAAILIAAAHGSSAAGLDNSLREARRAPAVGQGIPPVPPLPQGPKVPAGMVCAGRDLVGAGSLEQDDDRSLPGVAQVAAGAWPRPARPRLLLPLYVSFAALQVADVAGTARALEAGGREANPVMAPFAGHLPAMLALKTGATAATIYLAERLWKKNRLAASLLVAALNGAYAAIVAHNSRLAASR